MRHPARALAIALVPIALLAAACGDDDAEPAAPGSGARVVAVDMVDIAFEPDTVQVERGETIRFVFTNRGEVPHDAFIGDRRAQDEHEAEMRAADDAHGGHEDEADDAITVEPGDTGELTYTFERAGSVEIGCHQPGHYDAGMRVAVEVVEPA